MKLSSPRVLLPVLTGFAVLALSAIAVTSHAQPPGRGEGGGFGPAHGGGHARLFRAFHHLDLTDAQKEQLHAAMEGEQEAIKATGEALHTAQQALQQHALSDGYDEAHATALGQAVGQAMAETAKLHARLLHEAYGVLTPEQRTELAQVLAKAGTDRPGRGGHHRH